MDCVLTSFAHAINYTTDELIKYIGHDGTEILDHKLEPPYCYRGFSVFELSKVLYDLGWSTTWINKYACVYNCMMDEPKFDTSFDLVEKYLDQPRYCLSSDDHMIGVRFGIVLDLKDQLTDPKKFNYNVIYLINKI